MTIGSLYKLKRMSHWTTRVGDVIICIEILRGKKYFTGFNLRLQQYQHYNVKEVEVICE